MSALGTEGMELTTNLGGVLFGLCVCLVLSILLILASSPLPPLFILFYFYFF